MSRVTLGIETLLSQKKSWIAGRRLGLVAHPASVDGRLEHTLELLAAAGADVRALFGPEHGFAGEAQDMVPVGGESRGPKGLPLTSLYGATEATLSPAPDRLARLDALLIDLADVGARYYTFAWTAVLCVRACHRAGIDAVVLDRPNPLGGEAIEGAPQRDGFLSFVGLAPIPNRHGMTIGEIARFASRAEGTSDALTVVEMAGWRRGMWLEDTGAPWVMPSPNMPTPDTALVYPGACLLEATWASEGRGTTRPFELVGAPGIAPEDLARRLEAERLPGVRFRPTSFRPTFHKHAGRSCGGVQIHVTDRRAFLPYRTGVALLVALKAVAGDAFAWRREAYEFVADVPAIDLLAGGEEIRLGVEAGLSTRELAATWEAGERRFADERREFLFYA
ncbi:MAG: DUF1343 domain-containing protein [Proteobacteria bacterium]|jgi:uncharacterized protein YbbC (DUF1343 family)|nr:DUF1343 domain-containing protein [Pseudomonadota bacterium]